MAGEFVQSFALVRKKIRVSRFKGSMLLLSMFVRLKMGYVRAKIGLTGQFDRSQPGNYLQPCTKLKMKKVPVDRDVAVNE